MIGCPRTEISVCPNCGSSPKAELKKKGFFRIPTHSRMACKCGVSGPWVELQTKLDGMWPVDEFWHAAAEGWSDFIHLKKGSPPPPSDQRRDYVAAGGNYIGPKIEPPSSPPPPKKK